MKTKRILQIIGRMDRAGAETMIMNLYRVIDKEKYQFDFLYFTNDKCDYDDEIISLGGNIYRIPPSKNFNIITRLYKVFKLLKENTFYAIHAHTLFSNAYHLLAAFLAGNKNRIVHSHNTNDVNSNTLHGRFYQSVSRWIINALGTKFIACGVQAGDYLFNSSKQVILLPNAVDARLFNDARINKRAFFRRELNINDDNCLLLCQIGRMSNVKNHLFSLKIASKLKTDGINFKMAFIGDGVLKENLLKYCIDNNLENHVSFLGVRKDIPVILAGSDIMLMPSFYEGFPVVLVESQSSGVISLVSDKVSNEVDLGVGTVFFNSLDNLEDWINKIKSIKRINHIPSEEKMNILKSNGFDIFSSVKILENIYN